MEPFDPKAVKSVEEGMERMDRNAGQKKQKKRKEKGEEMRATVDDMTNNILYQGLACMLIIAMYNVDLDPKDRKEGRINKDIFAQSKGIKNSNQSSRDTTRLVNIHSRR